MIGSLENGGIMLGESRQIEENGWEMGGMGKCEDSKPGEWVKIIIGGHR